MFIPDMVDLSKIFFPRQTPLRNALYEEFNKVIPKQLWEIKYRPVWIFEVDKQLMSNKKYIRNLMKRICRYQQRNKIAVRLKYV